MDLSKYTTNLKKNVPQYSDPFGERLLVPGDQLRALSKPKLVCVVFVF